MVGCLVYGLQCYGAVAAVHLPDEVSNAADAYLAEADVEDVALAGRDVETAVGLQCQVDLYTIFIYI